MNKQAIVDFIKDASASARRAFARCEPVVIRENPRFTWPFRVQTEEGVELNGFVVREGAEQFCKDLDLEVKEEKTFYIESWKCEGDGEHCGAPCTVELVVDSCGLKMGSFSFFNRGCLTSNEARAVPTWVRLPDKPYEAE